jgi:dihydroorotate dehydrogenase (NAD+) catalytic subunit
MDNFYYKEVCNLSNQISANIAGLELVNPTILAAGVLGYTGLSMKAIINAGAGAVVTKTMGLKPRSGYLNPTIVQTNCGLLNAMGLPNPGISHFKEEIKRFKTINAPIIISIFGSSSNEFIKVAAIAENIGADAIELNVSCPHIKKAGATIGSNPVLVEEIIKKVKNVVHLPVIVKLTPNVTDIVEIAKTAEEAGADALTAINTVKAMAIEIETCRPILANSFGGLSGPAIKPIAVRCVFDIFRSVSIPIIGCGGISNWKDAIEFILAGASAVQIGTAIAFSGIDVFSSINKGIHNYLKRKNYQKLKEIIGLAHNF